MKGLVALPAAFVVTIAVVSEVEAAEAQIGDFTFGCSTPDGEVLKPKHRRWRRRTLHRPARTVGGVPGDHRPHDRPRAATTRPAKSDTLNERYADCLPIFEDQAKACAKSLRRGARQVRRGRYRRPRPGRCRQDGTVQTMSRRRTPIRSSRSSGRWRSSSAARSSIGPGTDYDSLASLDPGVGVRVTGKVSGRTWQRVDVPEDGGPAFVHELAARRRTAPLRHPNLDAQVSGKARTAGARLPMMPRARSADTYYDAGRTMKWSGGCSRGHRTSAPARARPGVRRRGRRGRRCAPRPARARTAAGRWWGCCNRRSPTAPARDRGRTVRRWRRPPPLHRMGAPDVAPRRLAQRPRGDQEGGVLAGAHVVDRLPAVAGAHARLGRGRVIGQVRAAFEVVLAEPGARQPAAHHREMGRLAVVRRAGERDLLVRHRIALGGAALDQRQDLDRLDGRARIDHRIGVAPAPHEAAGRVDHRRVHQMPALDRRAAGAFDHQRPSPLRLRLCLHRRPDPPPPRSVPAFAAHRRIRSAAGSYRGLSDTSAATRAPAISIS